MRLRRMCLISISSLLLCLALIACASFTQNAFKALSAARAGYLAGMNTAAELYSKGKLTESQAVELYKIAVVFTKAYTEAVDTLIAYQALEKEEDKLKAEKKINALLDSLANAVKLISDVLEGVEK
jgi:hypothetical protein